MKITRTILELQSELTSFRSANGSIGFVPTMGALHMGHLSLIEKSKKETNVTVVSIFVNPTQFNNSNDLKNYPRTFDQDIEKLLSFLDENDIVFAPEVKEIYPEEDKRQFNFGHIEAVMEGKHRPGHFNGVAQVVSKLFQIVKPNKAFFGEKDYQQLLVIKMLVFQSDIPLEVIGCPIVREIDGLAMSSRNVLLSVEQRKSAVTISQTLFKTKELKNKLSVNQLIDWASSQINSDKNLKVEYFNIVDADKLERIIDWNQSKRIIGCIAVQVGNVRLIDNLFY